MNTFFVVCQPEGLQTSSNASNACVLALMVNMITNHIGAMVQWHAV